MKSLIIYLIFFIPIIGFSQATNTPAKSKPLVLGQIDEIQSTQLSEKRILNIYLPEGYKQEDTTRYAVVYLLDGSQDEDFIHVVGLYQFNMFPWIERVPKSIVVGIANVDRRRDFTYPTTIQKDKEKYKTAGNSDKFIAFLEKELQPYIEKNFKVNQSKTIIGQSLGGLLATEILLKKPALFNEYIIISPSIWWDNGTLLKLDSPILDEKFTQPTKIYIGVGKEGLTPTEIPRVMEVDANLLVEKLRKSKSKNLKIYFDYLPEENHATVTHQALFNALRLLNPVSTRD
jgi:predicted alpha/beta superfamily hydrolase